MLQTPQSHQSTKEGLLIPPFSPEHESQLRSQWEKRFMDCFRKKNFAFEVKTMLWSASIMREQFTMEDLTVKYLHGELAVGETPEDNEPNLMEYHRLLEVIPKQVMIFNRQCDRIVFLMKIGLRSAATKAIFDLVDKWDILKAENIENLVLRFEQMS